MAVSLRGRTATFTPPPGAAALTGDFTDWERPRAVPVVSGAPITLTLPRDSWTEYAWLDAGGTPFADPDNPRRSLNPWWNYPRAVEVGRYATHPLWQQPEPPARGATHRLSWEGQVFPGTRRVIVYTPPNLDARSEHPVYYVQDGVAFYRTGRLGELMDRALAAGLVSPAVLVFVEPGDRSAEYYLNDRYLDFLLSEVLPRVEEGFPVRRDAAGRGVWGASLGGLISLYLGARHPELFSTVVAHSGAFIANPEAAARGEPQTRSGPEWLLEHLRAHPPRHLRVSLDAGTQEWLCAPNRRMAALLADLGVAHQYREYASGHNWVTWRGALPEALLFVQGV